VVSSLNGGRFEDGFLHGALIDQLNREFHERIRDIENDKKAGYNANTGKLYPYESAEGGSKTIGYGHKLKRGESFDNGITEQEARLLFQHDWAAARAAAAQTYGSDFESLPPQVQNVATDIQFNVVGGLRTYPKFMDAARRNDVPEMIKQASERYMIRKDGVKVSIPRRIELIKETLGQLSDINNRYIPVK